MQNFYLKVSQITYPKTSPRQVSSVLSVIILAALSACATKPATGPMVGAGPKAVAPSAVVTMAPIPNPEASNRHHVDRDAPPAAPPPKHTPPHVAVTHAPTSIAQPNPQQAIRLRAAGLEQLNRGSIDRAVELLRQAAQLDPTNKLIQHDLDRAIRIGQAVHARR